MSLRNAPDSLGSEGYLLTANPSKVSINSISPQGVFHGIQTFSQLLPVKKAASASVVSIPAIQIIDKPRFGWRGVLLDVGRYFYPVDQIKKQ